MTRLYLDSSALVKLVMEESESLSLEVAVLGLALTTSRISVVEVTKAAARSGPEADPAEILSLVALLDVDAPVTALAAITGGPALRALDAIHIATAVLLGPDIESFITYDTRQAEAARAAGLRVIAPGAA